MIKKLIHKFLKFHNKENQISISVEYSLQKYERTYKLLEEYDKEPTKDPEAMADPGRLRSVIRDFQKEVRTSRAASAV